MDDKIPLIMSNSPIQLFLVALQVVARRMTRQSPDAPDHARKAYVRILLLTSGKTTGSLKLYVVIAVFLANEYRVKHLLSVFAATCVHPAILAKHQRRPAHSPPVISKRA